MVPVERRPAALLLLALLLAGCARETGDFGRAPRNALDDRAKPFAGDMIARHLRGELVSDFNRTDDENVLRDRSWSIVRAPHAEDWFGHLLVEGQRTRILPEIDSRFDPSGYYAYLRRDAFRSSEARWNRLFADMQADTELVGPFWGEARRVREGDRLRLSTLDGRRDVSAEELRDATARIDENARVVDWVWRALRFRLRAYRIAIDRMMVETPSDRLWEANQLWNAYRRAIEAAEADFPAGVRRGAPGGARPSRYSQGAGIQEVVPQK
ncbi:MAG: hypothetical protein LWW93_01845 [Hyphomicrobiales bacterium]|nr:hypothetical protein [Hyphomicrobiales bacterium]